MIEFTNVDSVFIDDSDIVDWVKTNLSPDDVFNENDLVMWAEANGFTR